MYLNDSGLLSSLETVNSATIFPVRARGKLNYANDSKKGSREIYGTDGAEYKKEKGDKAWKQDIYTSKWRNQPTGFNRDFIAFLQTKKKDITVKEDKKTYTLRFETTDIKLQDENVDLFFGAMFRPIIVSSSTETGKMVAELTISKEDNKPLSFNLMPTKIDKETQKSMKRL